MEGGLSAFAKSNNSKYSNTMTSQTRILHYNILGEAELSETDARLIRLAREATYTSYSPYSRFSVGAAVLLQNGEIITGSNQENASYPATTCAERCAMFYANARYPDIPALAIAIAARTPDGAFTAQPVSPCGVCRQVLVETQHRYRTPLRVLLYGAEEIYEFATISDLLPFQFDGDSL